MSHKYGRREFLLFAAAAAAARGQSGRTDRLACNSWPFRAYFDTPEMHEYRDTKYPLLTQAEFPQFLADHFKIHNVEFLPQHFPDTNPSTVAAVKAGLKKAGSRCCNLMGVDIPGGVYSPSGNRKAITEAAERWVGVAAELGAPTITVALSGKEPVNPSLAANNLLPFVDTAQRRGIKVLFHNDDIRNESAETLTAIVKKIGTDRTGTCPDFGNFATRSAEYALKQLRMLAPYASSICHSKDGIADKGIFHADNFPASMKVMKDVGFKGIYSLEFEGLGDPMDGVRKLLNMTEQFMG